MHSLHVIYLIEWQELTGSKEWGEDIRRPEWVIKKWRDSKKPHPRLAFNTSLPDFTDLSTTTVSFSEFLSLTGPIPCFHCSLQAWGKQFNWSLKLIINEEFFQGAPSFLLLSLDLFRRLLLKSASQPGREQIKGQTEAPGRLMARGRFSPSKYIDHKLQDTLLQFTFLYHVCFEVPSRGECVALKKKKPHNIRRKKLCSL